MSNSNVKHTPGPWQIRGVGETRTVYRSTDTSVYPVATVTADNIKRFGSGGVDANARLIAAAPDAVTLFEDLQEYLCEHGGEAVELLSRIDEWLNKATGGAK